MNLNIDIEGIECPKFAWIVMFGLGCMDLIRGIIHTVFLQHAAMNIFVIDMSGGVGNQMLLLGTFGISNYLTGALFILISLYARHLVPLVLPIIPLAYFTGSFFINLNLVAEPTGALGGIPMMLVYMIVCWGTFAAIVIIKIREKYYG